MEEQALASPSPAAAVVPTAELTGSDQPGAAEGSASADSPASSSSSSGVDMNAVLRSMIAGSSSASTSNLEQLFASSAEPASDAESDDVSADGEATTAPTQPGRRASKARTNAQRIAELEAELAARDPAAIREQVLAEQRQQAEASAIQAAGEQAAERFRRLQNVPDYELSGEDYAWREEQKELLAKWPEAQRLLESLLAQDRAALTADLGGKQQAFWTDLERQLDAVAQRKGLDRSLVAGAKNFEALGENLFAAGADAKAAELQPLIDQLQAEVADLRQFGPRGLALARGPFTGGASAAGAGSAVDFNAWIREQARSAR